MAKVFTFIADTINGEILEFPESYNIPCGQYQAVGVNNVRAYTVNDCIEVRRVFQILYGRKLLGSTSFDTLNQFNQFVASNCQCCEQEIIGCDAMQIGGCYIQINGCYLNKT